MGLAPKSIYRIKSLEICPSGDKKVQCSFCGQYDMAGTVLRDITAVGEVHYTACFKCLEELRKNDQIEERGARGGIQNRSD